MVDVKNQIIPMLQFTSKDDFYYLQILQRKKEHPELGANSRIIKNYYISSLEFLESHYDEIKNLCNLFNARAMLRLNKRSFKKVAFKTLQNLANTMSNEEYSVIQGVYDRAVGQEHNEKNPTWIVDLDYNKESGLNDIDLQTYKDWINECLPKGNKIIMQLPTKNGIHLITKPFNIQQFNLNRREHIVDIHKDNPINLYIPD